MDQIDRTIIMELGRDGRASGSEIAKRLPINGVAARLRLQRLLQSTVRVKALVNSAKIGFPIYCYLGIKAEPALVGTVAQSLNEHACMQYVNRVAGVFDIVARMSSPSLQELHSFVQSSISTIKGVTDVETSIIMEPHVEFQSLSSKYPMDVVHPPPGIDLIDLRMISCLIEDGRATARELARALELSELTAQRRLKRLINERIITIRGMVKMTDLGFPVSATLALDVDPQRSGEIARTLRKQKQLLVVGASTGRYNLMAVGIFRSNEELDNVLKDSVYPLDGVKGVSISVSLRQLSDRFLWVVPRLFGTALPAEQAPVS